MNVPRRLLYVILIFATLSAVAFTLDYFNIRLQLPSFEELTPPRGGFYRGFTGKGVLFFITYESPQYGECPLVKYSTLHSNKFNLYAFSFSTRDITLEVETYLVRFENRTVKEGNITRTETVEVPYDIQTFKVPIHTIANSFTKTEVELPTTLKKRRVDIKLDGRTIFTFKHETWRAYIPAPRYTFGTLFLDRLAYMAGTTLVCLLAFAVAKATINRIKYVPEMPRWVIAFLPTILLMLAAFGAIYIVYYYALLEAAYTLIPIFILAWVYGLYLVRPKPIIWYLSKIVNAEQPTRRLEAIEMFRQGGREDLVANEEAQLAVLKAYLPKQLSEEEIREALREIIAELGATGPKQLGPVMREAMQRLKGKADGRLVNRLARELLSGN